MADKTYKLNFEMSDGSTKSVQFTAPQGPRGEKGDTGAAGAKGDTGAAGAKGDTGPQGVGITDITINEV